MQVKTYVKLAYNGNNSSQSHSTIEVNMLIKHLHLVIILLNLSLYRYYNKLVNYMHVSDGNVKEI